MIVIGRTEMFGGHVDYVLRPLDRCSRRRRCRQNRDTASDLQDRMQAVERYADAEKDLSEL